MRTKYFFLIFVIFIFIVWFFFNRTAPVASASSFTRNIRGELFASKAISIPKAFGISNADSGFFVLAENNPVFVNFQFDTFRTNKAGATYYITKLKDTVFYLSENSTTFYKKFDTITEVYPLERNSGYVQYENGYLYYEKENTQNRNSLEIQTILIRKKLLTGGIDTLLDVNGYIRQQWKNIKPEEYSQIATGKFYSLKNDIVAFVPKGINRIFLFNKSTNKHIVFKPMSDREIIRWHSVSMHVPELGEVFTYKPVDGGAEQILKGIYNYNGKYLLAGNTVHKQDNVFYYYLDLYDEKSLKYIESFQVKASNPKDAYLISLTIANDKLLTLDSKNNVIIYPLPL